MNILSSRCSTPPPMLTQPYVTSRPPMYRLPPSLSTRKAPQRQARRRRAKVAPEKGFWASLFGDDRSEDYGSDRYAAVYDRSLESGSTVVTVRVSEQQVDRISAILEKHNPIDLDERASQYGVAQTAGSAGTMAPSAGARGNAATATDSGAIQLAEEQLSVGKRAVSGGTTRIRRYVVETPVQEQVNLRTEKVTLERRPVSDGRPVGNADFTDKTVEMTEMSEQAVVAKTARVTEEVRLRKDASERVETVTDTVRRDEVKVEQTPGETAVNRGPGSSSVKPGSPSDRTSKI